MTERVAHDRILRWTRSRTRKGNAVQPVMRKTVDGEHLVVDMGLSEKDPDSEYSWARRDVVHARGATWVECARQLREKGWLS